MYLLEVDNVPSLCFQAVFTQELWNMADASVENGHKVSKIPSENTILRQPLNVDIATQPHSEFNYHFFRSHY